MEGVLNGYHSHLTPLPSSENDATSISQMETSANLNGGWHIPGRAVIVRQLVRLALVVFSTQFIEVDLLQVSLSLSYSIGPL
jgi:hypothetical protein